MSVLWNNVCVSERNWLNYQSRGVKKHLNGLYKKNRKIFDKEVQKAKRMYWYQQQEE